jgi:hypothetical protein
MLLVPAFSLAFGCVQTPDKQVNTDPEFCEGTTCETLPGAALSGVFVSGHLGNYRDCPGDGWTGDSTAPSPGADESAPSDGDIAGGACADDTNCQPILNCEDAQATISLSNIGEGLAEGVQIDRVELFNDAGEKVATLPVMATSEAGSSFDGELDSEETATLRIDYQGPQDPYTLLATPSSDERSFGSASGTIRIVISADNADDTTVEGKQIYSIPSVDT